jgi:hypothetical protein
MADRNNPYQATSAGAPVSLSPAMQAHLASLPDDKRAELEAKLNSASPQERAFLEQKVGEYNRFREFQGSDKDIGDFIDYRNDVGVIQETTPAAAVEYAQSPWLSDLYDAAAADPTSPYQAGLVQEASYNRSGGYGRLGDIGNAIDPDRASGQIEGVASRYGTDVVRQAAGIEGLSNELRDAPSYVDSMVSARMGQANSEAMARAASTRGANANLQMRETADANAAAGRQLIADAAGMKAKEMSDRYGQRGALLRDAAGVSATGAATQGNLYDAAGQSNLAANQAKAGIQSDVMSGLRDESALRQSAYGKAGDLAIASQSNRQDAMATGLGGVTDAQSIQAQTYNAAEDRRAARQAAAQQRRDAIIGSTVQAGTMGVVDYAASSGKNSGVAERQRRNDENYYSDVRAKTDIESLDTRGLLEMASMAKDPDANREALEPVEPYSYRYKANLADAIGADTEPRAGVMAQDLERSPQGASVVHEAAHGKALDPNRALGFSLAGVAGLDKRVQLLEDALGRSGRKAA